MFDPRHKAYPYFVRASALEELSTNLVTTQ
jgi:hypothetical protein